MERLVTITMFRRGEVKPIPPQEALENYILPAIFYNEAWHSQRTIELNGDMHRVECVDEHGNTLIFETGMVMRAEG